MIRAMYRSMGRTPTEANVNQTMRAIQDAQKKSRK
ncbi:MAG: YneF family protein [bacterium]|nr:YneF family protein [bacterium]